MTKQMIKRIEELGVKAELLDVDNYRCEPFNWEKDDALEFYTMDIETAFLISDEWGGIPLWEYLYNRENILVTVYILTTLDFGLWTNRIAVFENLDDRVELVVRPLNRLTEQRIGIQNKEALLTEDMYMAKLWLEDGGVVIIPSEGFDKCWGKEVR